MLNSLKANSHHFDLSSKHWHDPVLLSDTSAMSLATILPAPSSLAAIDAIHMVITFPLPSITSKLKDP
ncbi:hypothetical protein E2C01_029080 [Portunus trituberculatus]|uniref:Uncharacterized protein n=1 Tax=Portunus trituberculatus TaxID=210409 RepID=A0A5B7EN82_PORTR|nr:hypothetical protein [Portunus trituberculatus]